MHYIDMPTPGFYWKACASSYRCDKDLEGNFKGLLCMTFDYWTTD